ncbi:MAG: flavin reductase [Tannerellaceae bacterium]|nr:flavin reductase [Tannerellaceae bacterium]MCD8264610.1 flavin reductase [Tannerellaceae bacterium]
MQTSSVEKTTYISTGEMNFDQLFKQLSPEEISDDVFTLAGKVFPVITAGKEEHYNSMTGSGGGFGVLFRKPVTWCVIRKDRYTLELIRQEHTYTLSYFADAYKEQVLFLGSKSGRDSEKMKEVELTAVRMPSGNISFKEAQLIIECKLLQITEPAPGDFYTQEARDYIKVAYKEAKDYRKYVFGEITNVWMKSDLSTPLFKLKD